MECSMFGSARLGSIQQWPPRDDRLSGGNDLIDELSPDGSAGAEPARRTLEVIG